MNCVYLVEANGAYKIGSTNNVKRRLLGLQSGSPIPLRLIHTVNTDRFRELERALHQRFADKRLEGTGIEWFQLSEDDVAWFTNNALSACDELLLPAFQQPIQPIYHGSDEIPVDVRAMLAEYGRKGGSVKSEAKAEAARKNGQKRKAARPPARKDGR